MEPTQELIDDIYREKVLRARKMSPGEKLLDGPRLFEWACQWTLAGIRDQNPGISDEEAQKMLRKRLDLLDRMEHGL